MDRDVLPSTLESTAAVPSSTKPGSEGARAAMLEQIATALDISLDTLARPDGPHGDRARVLAENTEALTLFARLADPDARQRGLAYLRWIAEQSSTR